MFFCCQAHENQLEIEKGVFNTYSFQILNILFYFIFFNKMDVLMPCRTQTEESTEHNWIPQSYSIEQLIPIIPTSCHPAICLHNTEYDYMYRKNSVLRSANFMTFYVYFLKVTRFLVKYLDLYKVIIKLNTVIGFHSTVVHWVAL